jgi:putative nucleotidyltransferase with HDIG domain
MNNKVKEALLGSSELPTMPVVASKLLSLLSSPDYKTKELSRLIKTDVGITTKILKIANSAFYGCSREITSVDRAVVLLGARTMKSLVIAASTKGVYKNSGLMEHLMWEHGVGVAIGAHIIAIAKGIPAKEDALVSGLLHDIGKTILLQTYPEKFDAMYQEMYNDDLEFEDLEIKTFGFSHTELGALLVKTWKLSEAVELTIANQNDPFALQKYQPEYLPLCGAVRFANDVCLYKGIGVRQAHEDLELSQSPGAVILEMNEEECQEMADEIEDKYQIEKDLFN